MTTISAIHVARRDAGIDEDTARDLYQRETGVRSLREMSPGQQVRTLQALRALNRGPLAHDLAGPYAGKLRALWISGYNLGVIRDRKDSAMLAFVRGQTGIEHTRFLRDAADARKAVEALKKWLSREAGVDWSDHADIDAVIAAQGELLHLDGDGASPDEQAFGAWRRDELDRRSKISVSQQLGVSIRKGRK